MKAKAVKIADGVYWVGVIHWHSRTFHGYGIPGTTYNAYLVFGEEKTVLIDNVYRGMFEQFDARVKDAFDRSPSESAASTSRASSSSLSVSLGRSPASIP